MDFLYHLKSIYNAIFKALFIRLVWKKIGLILYNLEVVLLKLRECAFMRPQMPLSIV